MPTKSTTKATTKKTTPRSPSNPRRRKPKPAAPKTPAATPTQKTIDTAAATVDYAPIQRRSSQKSAVVSSIEPVGVNQVRVEACFDIQQLVIGVLSHFFPG